jgi:hypothetical protein
MIRARGRYVDQKVELKEPLALPEGSEIEVIVRPVNPDEEKDWWLLASMERLQETWDNPQDAMYDDWKKLYGVASR